MQTFREHRWQSFLQNYEDRARLLISCPDKPGIVAAVTSFYMNKAQILWNPANIPPILKEAPFS